MRNSQNTDRYFKSQKSPAAAAAAVVGEGNSSSLGLHVILVDEVSLVTLGSVK